MISTEVIWYSVIKSLLFLLLLGVTGLVMQGLAGYKTIRRSARSGRRLRPESEPGR
jgi:hypothetical protein